jgi:aldehyde dehydrogenase (NAD+)
MVRTLNHHFIDATFVDSHGREAYAVNSAVTREQLAEAILGDDVDANRAVEAATRALPSWSATTLEERAGYLQKLADAFRTRREEMASALVEEFGTPAPTADYIVDQSPDWFVDAQELLTRDTFVERVGDATVKRVPVGVS